ncbi:hypothetical protein ACHAXA_001637 [Cyclostephanos tholiformis]|uniref:NADP-dependent oxidoreductase domain-containing protein n=1 Tax=Cyclostephanos tholiformis TaxID=382380 RepID=A0ABD3RVB9_9STRA
MTIMLSRRRPSLLFASSPLLLVAALSSIDGILCCQPNNTAEYRSSPTSAGRPPAVVTFPLKSGSRIPLVGMGIGNLAHDVIPRAVLRGMALGVRLIDTARKSENEGILANAIAALDDDDDGDDGDGGSGVDDERSSLRSGDGGKGDMSSSAGGENDNGGDDDDPIHVVTKVWYTHLGYERTKLSVMESIEELSLPARSKRRLHVHLLLHWPRCDDGISWMNCEMEEEELPKYVKDAGSPPHLDKDNAYKESWRALEDIFLQRDEFVQLEETNGVTKRKPYIASIGVSNFNNYDMRQLLQIARITPHIYQGDSWLAFHDADLMDLIAEHEIFFQAYSVFGRILEGEENAPRAYEILSDVTREVLSSVYPRDVDFTEEHSVVTVATVLLAFFSQYNVGVVPRSSSPYHQRQNSPKVVASVVRHLTENQILQLKKAISALMKGKDNNVVTVSFVNSLSTAIQIHWIHPETNEETPVSRVMHPGSVEAQDTYPGHRFVAYDPDRLIRREFVVDANYGDSQTFNVEL